MKHEIPVRCYGIAAVVVRRTRGRRQVLMLRRATTLRGQWCQIAGGIEAHESAWQAAVREIREETQLDVTALYSAEILEQFYEVDENAIWIAPVFVAFVDAAAQVTLNDEHTEYRWVSIRRASRMVPFPQQRRVLRHIRREFIRRTPPPLTKIDGSG